MNKRNNKMKQKDGVKNHHSSNNHPNNHNKNNLNLREGSNNKHLNTIIPDNQGNRCSVKNKLWLF